MTDEIITIDMLDVDENTIPFKTGPLSQVMHRVWSQLPRRHTFFLLVWIEMGMGWHCVDFVRYAIQPNTLYLITPNQVQYWDVEHPPIGWYLIFKREFFLLTGAEHFFSKLTLFNSLHPITTIPFETEQATPITALFAQMSLEYQAQQRDGWVESVAAYLQLLLIQAQRQRATLQPPEPQTARVLLTRRFLTLVRQNVSTAHNVGAYAQQLGVTPGYLTETVKTVMGLPAGELVRRQLTLEAKRWLAHSDLTATQVAQQLGFKDASYFSRFFKRETGQSPRAFRHHFMAPPHYPNAQSL